MRKTNPILLSILILLVSFGCVAPGIVAPTPIPGAMETTVAQLIVVALTQTAQSIPPTAVPTDTPPFTFTPVTPSLTPSATWTPTPVFTSTPAVPVISVSVATNCRLGPGRVYDRVGALLVGQTAEVIGRNNAANYWYIRNPNRTTDFCWLWGEYATVTGNLAALPVFTPPPTPTPMPDFDADYARLESCAGSGWWVDIKLENQGGITFRSIALTVRDLTNDAVVSLYSDDFTDRYSCSDSDTYDTLPAGDDRIVSSPYIVADPRGHDLRVTVTLCSNIGQSGTCITRVLEFEP